MPAQQTDMRPEANLSCDFPLRHPTHTRQHVPAGVADSVRASLKSDDTEVYIVTTKQVDMCRGLCRVQSA